MATKDEIKNKKYSVISLFSGCGGLDLGFTGGFSFLGKNYPRRNFEIIWANDIDENACQTFRKNFKKQIFWGDINGYLRANALPDHHADVVLGGFPCQDFSYAGKRMGFRNDRGRLYKSMVEVVRRVRPYIFVAENVKGLLTMDEGGAIKKVVRDFGALGYHVEYYLLKAANYGVPQTRERVLIIGARRLALPPFQTPPKHVLTKENWVTLKEAIGDLENLRAGAASNHYWSGAKKNNGQGNNLVSADKPGPTMRTEHHGNIEWHWNGKRRLSAREAARIQSFPDNFVFYPSTSSAYKQIGNAVPPVMAWHIAKAIENFLDRNLSHDLRQKRRPSGGRVSGVIGEIQALAIEGIKQTS